jgi:lipopolysaccharide/colanic/teichoic acid biosynthesis glycosyltransferase
MIIRLFDAVVSALILVLCAPLLLGVALAIKLSSPGPVLFLAERAGLKGKTFRMFKFRSMHIHQGGSDITATNDARVFAVGKVIRTLKLDELPQFVNVLLGEMALVGPRPEAPAIVAEHYTPWMHDTLNVLPGVTSPGAIFYYAFGDELLDSDDPEAAYVESLLAPKLALDLAYSQRQNLLSNMVVIAHTVVAIVGKAMGKSIGPLARDVKASGKWVDIARLEQL